MYCNVPFLALICPNMPLFGLFLIQIRIFDPDADFDHDAQISRTYCNVPLLALICCKMALFGLFCCNLDPDLDF